MQFENQILHGDALSKLKELESESVDCIITSPPYWSLRDYKVEGQIGIEKTIDEYVNNLVSIFDEAKRVLKKEGSAWIVLGDTYYGSNGKTKEYKNINPNVWERTSRKEFNSISVEKTCKVCNNVFIGKPKSKFCSIKCLNTLSNTEREIGRELPSKSLCMIPERFAIAMIDNNWVLRNKIIWWKPNCMPSSAKDRFTVDYENIYFFTKSKKYYFKTQYEPISEAFIERSKYSYGGNQKNVAVTESCKSIKSSASRTYFFEKRTITPNPLGRIKRCIWSIPTKPFPEAHFAVFPEQLVKQCLDAGCPSEGICLDPFMGAGTTALTALKNNRKFVGIELNESYIDIARKRIDPYLKQQVLVFHNRQRENIW